MSPQIRFLQCSGCRFDSPSWEGPEEWISQRNQDLWKTFETMLLICQSEKIDLLFITGNLFEQEYARKSTVERVAKSLGTLKTTSVFIVPGEKDPYVTTSAYRLAVWPSNVQIFSSGISCFNLKSHNISVYGAGWTAYQQDGTILNQEYRVKNDGTIPIMLLHSKTADSNSPQSFPLSPEQIAASGLVYLALGYLAFFSGIQNAGKTIWADSGVLEARNFNEQGPHGVIVGKLDQDDVELEFRELGQRQYITKYLEFHHDYKAIIAKLLSETSSEEREQHLFRITFSNPVPKDADINTLQKLLAEKFRFIEVDTPQTKVDPQFGLDFMTPDFSSSIKTSPEECNYLSLSQIYFQKIKDYQSTAITPAEQEQWELIKKIGLAALEQGRISYEN
ncbi:putative metallophosphoesterase YhaO [Desulfosporosinus acididurans]|uniref:Putative metallophosphoesterase YhaO n=1 Tax=Desulfosporosinus acididurans TaxID=476652 RepID=A0A0J1FMK5_9FIRM|nr:hypothetical protein [Desulfosporosinus acididurans]KLU64203.1 putative metallophosphoesterase YhaO [Desulfosporosinus acididurans]